MLFHIFVIHTQKLTLRQARLHGTIQTIRTTAQAAGYEVKVTMILKPDPDYFDEKTIPLMEKRIKYEPVGIEEFDKIINTATNSHVLSIEELSNYEKHREAWRRITETSADPDSIYMVIEDDIFMIPEEHDVLREVINDIDHTSYDFLTFSVADQSVRKSDQITTLNFRNIGKILPSKESYFISRRAARVLYDQSETIRFTMRTMMSYILCKNHSLNVMYPSKRIFIDGSKLGIHPSTTHGGNVLIYNQEFMELWQFISHAKPPLREIREIYKRVAHVRNPDIMHIYGVLLYRAGELHEAQDVFVEAVKLMQEQQGLLSFRSELLNNAINIHEQAQWDLPAIIEKPSKYKN